jgi:uncharacterized protein YdcH (DUF465 family)
MSVKLFKSLLIKSAQIDREIEKEHNRHWPDWMRLLRLKKLRLAIKDNLARLLKNPATAQKVRPNKIKFYRNNYREI